LTGLPGFDICGAIVGVVRSCYRAPCRYYRGGPIGTIRYYFVPKTNPIFYGDNVFWPATEMLHEFTNVTNPGEIAGTPRAYDRGVNFRPECDGTSGVGTHGDFAGLTDWPGAPPAPGDGAPLPGLLVTNLPFGWHTTARRGLGLIGSGGTEWDRSMVPINVGVGGLEWDRSMVPVNVGVGGLEWDGSMVPVNVGIGGNMLDGVSLFPTVGRGGLRLDGAAYFPTVGRGGVKLDGIGAKVNVCYGGLRYDGSAKMRGPFRGSGGVMLDGTIRHVPTLHASGGDELDGRAHYFIRASGGVSFAGQGNVFYVFYYHQGGLKFDGTASQGHMFVGGVGGPLWGGNGY
jgi:hypothetical protein